jgi:hypothetical protein
MRMWFYVKTPNLVHTLEDGSEVTIFPYASEMKEMKPLSKVDPLLVILDECKAYDRAFALASYYSGGRVLVEEMAASDF